MGRVPPIIQIEIVGPMQDLQQLKQDVNEAIEELGTAILKDIKLYHDKNGWFAMLWWFATRAE